MSASFDVVLVGAGHNSLIAQAYLGRLGLRTLALDRNLQPGGGLSTVEDPALPGVYHNLHSVFHRAVTLSPWFHDLELGRHGVRYVEPEANVAMLREDGEALVWYTDLERTCASIASFSPRDAAAFREIHAEFADVPRQVILPWNAHPPESREALRERLDRFPAGRRLREVEPLSAHEFAFTRFEHPQIRALMLFLSGAREVDMYSPCHGWLIPALIASPVRALLCVGGSAALARGLHRAVQESGGQIWSGMTVREITVQDGRATGVVCDDGTVVRAERAVISTLNPQQTVLELTGSDCWSAEIVEGVRGYRYNQVGPLFGVNVALREPLRYRSREPEQVDRAFMVILGLETPETVEAMYREHPAGRITEPLTLWGASPTVHDPSQARAGYHTAFMWEKVPFALNGVAENWDAFRDAHAAEVLERWSRYAPNLAEAVQTQYALSPLDTLRHFPNMAGGDLTVGWLGAEQLGAHRPIPALSAYRTPVGGLYLGGSCMHPGGNITGYPGHNVAGVVAHDLGLAPWWSPPEYPAA